MDKQMFNEAPFSNESRLGDILTTPQSDSVMQFIDIYNEWHNTSLDNAVSDSDRETATHKLNTFKGLYLLICFRPIWDYIIALVVKYAPSDFLELVLPKARELGYICPVKDVFAVLNVIPTNISRLMLANLDNANVLLSFEEGDSESFVAALREARGNTKDFLLLCGYFLQIKPFEVSEESFNMSTFKQKLSVIGLENPYSDAALSEDEEIDIDEEPLSLDYAKEFVGKVLWQITQLHELIPSKDLNQIDIILESNIYKEEFKSYLLALNENEEAQFDIAPSSSIHSEQKQNREQGDPNDKRPLPPADLQKRKRLKNVSLINIFCQYLQNWFEGSNIQDLKYVFFGIGDVPPSRSLNLSTEKKKLTMLITYLFGSKNIKRENWVYFANYIKNDREPVYPLDLKDPSWKSNPPSGFASAEEKKDFAETVIPNAIRAKLKRDLTKEEEEDLK